MTDPTPVADIQGRPQASGTISSGQLFGVLLLLAGIAWLLNDAGYLPGTGEQVLSVLLIILGIGMLFVNGHNQALLIFIGIALSLTLLTGSPVLTFDLKGSNGAVVGDRSESPTIAPGGKLEYGAVLGDLRVDLSDLAIDDETTVSTHTALGDVTIIVPEDQPVELKTNVGLGDVKVFGQRVGGTGNNTFSAGSSADRPLLRLEVTVGLGDVSIRHPR